MKFGCVFDGIGCRIVFILIMMLRSLMIFDFCCFFVFVGFYWVVVIFVF